MDSKLTDKHIPDDSLYRFPVSATSIVRIPIRLIVPNPAQPRKTFSDDSLSALADSIRRHGVLQPLLVRSIERHYELIAGERRLRAAAEAELDYVPCIIRSDNPCKSAELAIIENLQREDLNIFEEAEAIRTLIETCSLTQESAAAHLSCSQSYIANKLRLLKLPPDQRRKILEFSLTERHARALLRIKDNDERESVLSVIIKRGLNVAAAEEYIEEFICDKERAASAKRASRFDCDLKRRLLSRDMRLFYNSIDRAVESVRSCGFEVESTRRRAVDGTEISILIKSS